MKRKVGGNRRSGRRRSSCMKNLTNDFTAPQYKYLELGRWVSIFFTAFSVGRWVSIFFTAFLVFICSLIVVETYDTNKLNNLQ